jgi:hypothetical protein
MKPHALVRALLLVAAALFVLAPFAPARAEDEPELNFIQQALAGLTIGEGTMTQEVAVFPILAPEKPERVEIAASSWAKNVGWHEPEFPKKRYNVGVANNETKPLLVLGGTLLGGGARDRMFPRDVLIPAGGRVELGAIVTSPSSEQRKDPVGFRVGTSLAPPYLRERAEFNPSNTLVPNFARHFLDFRNEGDERKSLAAINASTQLTKLCLPCHEGLAAFPSAEGGRVVGLITAVRGRIRSLEMFGDNHLLKAWFEPLLKSHTFAAAAIALKAKKLRIKDPAKEDWEAALADMKVEAEKLLDSLQKAKYKEGDAPKDSVGEYLILRTSNSTRGTGTALDGRLVHLSVFPYDPFEHALFSSRLKVPGDLDEYSGLGEENLEGRLGRGQRLTEYEKRLLDRMRKSRSGGAAGGLGPIGGGRRR